MVSYNYFNAMPPYMAPRGEYPNYYKRSQLCTGQLPAFGRRRGHRLFVDLIRSARPIIKNLRFSAVKGDAPTLLNTGKGLLSDVLGGKNCRSSIINWPKNTTGEVMDKATRYLIGGSGAPPAKRLPTAQGATLAKKMKKTVKRCSTLF